MLKKILTVTVLSLLVVSVSFAQDIKKTGGLARLSGMGLNPYVIDPFFNTVNTAWNGVYNNFILADIGTSASPSFGAGGSGQYVSASFSAARRWTFGGILARNDFPGYGIALLDPGSNGSLGAPFSGVVSTVNSLRAPGSVLPLDNNLVLMATYRLRNTIIGLGVAYASTSNESTLAGTPQVTTEGSASQLGFNLGVISDLSRNLKLDASATILLPSASFETSSTGDTETKASQTFIGITGRAFWRVNPNLRVVPLLAFVTVSGTVDSGLSRGSVDFPSLTSFAFGGGLNYKIGDFLLAGGVIFSSTSYDVEATAGAPKLENSATIFPIWNLGVEWHLIDWLVGRLGYVAVTGSTTSQTPATSSTVNEFVATFFGPPQRGITLGVGFRFGDFSLDATVNEDVLRQGFNIVGGGGPTFFLMTASYALP
ncbi:MAG: hypothetical protein JSW63_13205 [Ignavibacterium sp.]|nr:MAG: hypothetical protein JSW63_13205 [Ignavibacterium sp.]